MFKRIMIHLSAETINRNSWKNKFDGRKPVKVKAVEIAKKLNISKSTVSLALNNKPGVSEETREKIFRCMEEMSNPFGTAMGSQTEGTSVQTEVSLSTRVVALSSAETVQTVKRMIKIIVIDNELNIGINSEMDLWSDVYALIEKEVKRLGYTLGITFIKYNKEEIQQAVEEANDPVVAGVILEATEMQPEHLEPFRKIRKKMVIYDNDLGPDYNCVVIDGVAAARDSVDYLVERGNIEIGYLANTDDIYNFRQRRSGFRAGLRKHNLALKEDSMIYIGKRIEEVYQNMKRYLETSPELPDAFIMENYQVSIGVVRALKEKNIRIPEDISLIGIDELPSYLTGDIQLTTVSVVHEERAKILVLLLEQEIQEELHRKYKVLSNCSLIEGNSVKSKIV